MSCSTTNVVIAPGPGGANGVDGSNGSDGVTAFSVTVSSFVVPVYDELVPVNVTIELDQADWIPVGVTVYIEGAGYYIVQGVSAGADPPSIQASNNGAASNTAAGTTIGVGKKVCAAGVTGATASLSGAAGGDLTGTYPNPTLDIFTLKGELYTFTGSAYGTLTAGTDNQTLHADSGEANGLAYRAIDLTGATTDLSGTLGLANGGTGETSAADAYNALSPLTTRGDIVTGDASGAAQRLALGATGTVLTSDGSDAYWTEPASASFGGDAKVVRFTSTGPTTLSDTPDDAQSGVIFICTSSNPGSITLPNALEYATASSSKFLSLLQENNNQAAGMVVANADSAGNDVRKETTSLGAASSVAIAKLSSSLAGTYQMVKFRALPDGAGGAYWLLDSFNEATNLV